MNDREIQEPNITDEERQKIIITRNRLTAWFGS